MPQVTDASQLHRTVSMSRSTGAHLGGWERVSNACRGSGTGTMLGLDIQWEQAVIDAQDPVALGRCWAKALGWVIVNDDVEDFEIRAAADRLPGMIFEQVTDAKQHKNRVHLDFRPGDQEAEVQRLVGLGASHIDIGQGDVSWVVLADPEGNEFCVLKAS